MDDEKTAYPPSDSAAAQPTTISLANPVIAAMAPVAARSALAAIAAFDGQMADFARRADAAEVMLAQLRLAWWRDEIAALAIAKSRPDPLLVQLAEMKDILSPDRLVALLDSWESLLLAEPFDLKAANEFARQRGDAVFALATAANDDGNSERVPSGAVWALTDLALNLSDRPLAQQIFANACNQPEHRENLPRPLYALDRWARRVAANGGARQPWREQAMLLRIGVFGR